MTRLSSPPDRADVAESEVEAYDAIMAMAAARGDLGLSASSVAMLQTPQMGAVVRELGRAIRLAPTRAETFSYADFELAVHCLGVKAGFIEHHHILDALAQGVRPEALQEVLHGERAALTDEERAIVDFCTRLVDRAMTDDCWSAVRELRGERAVIELSVVAGFVWTTILWQLAYGIDGVTAEEVEALLRSHRQGTLELPDERTARRAR